MATNTTSKPRRKTRSAEEVARSYFEAVAARNADEMAKHWHADGVDDLVPVGILRGPDEVRDFFNELFTAVPDAELTVEDTIVQGSKAVVRWRTVGTFDSGIFQGIEPTGRRVELRGADCLEVKSGKIIRNTAYWDGAGFARGVGLLPPRDSGGERAMLSAFNTFTRGRAAVRRYLENR